ncbi:unnamed protein product, partial [Mesorhabditis belari]|uniref:LRAT domain-containing protein n=1 Tax=Mesorhabditis belari TaxID=2138241 RepID=A0AAF3FJQ0_9BILA
MDLYDKSPFMGTVDPGVEGAVCKNPARDFKGQRLNTSPWLSAQELVAKEWLIPGDLIEIERHAGIFWLFGGRGGLGQYSHWAVYVGKSNDGQPMVIHRTGDKNEKAKAKIRLGNFYEVAKKCICSINNYHDDRDRIYPPSEIVKRAKSKIGSEGYHLAFSNCEHFSMWCRYGYTHSGQVEATLNSVRGRSS